MTRKPSLRGPAPQSNALYLIAETMLRLELDSADVVFLSVVRSLAGAGVKEVIDYSLMTKHTAYLRSKTLRQRGLLEATRDAENQRFVVLRLTKQGETAMRTLTLSL